VKEGLLTQTRLKLWRMAAMAGNPRMLANNMKAGRMKK
jgi:hypothetical protein